MGPSQLAGYGRAPDPSALCQAIADFLNLRRGMCLGPPWLTVPRSRPAVLAPLVCSGDAQSYSPVKIRHAHKQGHEPLSRVMRYGPCRLTFC
jgi:hypothetical protein